MKAQDIQTVVQSLTKSKVKFISGKFFANDVEVKKIDSYIYNVCLCNQFSCKSQDIDEIKKQLQILSDEDIWPELPIVSKARKLGPITKDMEEVNNAPFQLEPKQLLILNILLFHPREEVMFITTGRGKTGKSTYLNIIKQIYNDDVASIPLSELNGFMVAEAVKKRLIASDELGKGELDTKILKTLISKQELDVNPKYGKPFHATCQSSLFYCCNKAPKIDVSDSGTLRRIIFYERDKEIENPDTSLNKRRYTEDELLWFVRRALAFEAAYENWKDEFRIETYKYLMKDHSVYICRDALDYEAYREMCKSKGLKAYSEPNWRDIKDLFEQWLMILKSDMK